MTMDRANPFADLNEFQAKPKPKPVQKAEIEKLAQENGFPSRQPTTNSANNGNQKSVSNRKARRYITGRNKQINIKATSETIERLYKLADERNAPLGEILKLAIDCLELSKPK